MVELNKLLKKYDIKVVRSGDGYTVGGESGVKLFPLLFNALCVSTTVKMLNDDGLREVMLTARRIDNGTTV